MEKTTQTPSQTIGPFFAFSLAAEQYGYYYNSIINETLIQPGGVKNPIYITGNVFDGNGNAVSDALVEIWQADHLGNYGNLPFEKKADGFSGFGRSGTGTHAENRYFFTTIKPGCCNGQAPHINIIAR
jgi:protocatechuate 3,4-dioxygenase alpha subunit